MRKCKRCGEILPLSEYYIRNDNKPYCVCKKCIREERKQRYWEDDKYRRTKQDKARARYWINRNENN